MYYNAVPPPPRRGATAGGRALRADSASVSPTQRARCVGERARCVGERPAVWIGEGPLPARGAPTARRARTPLLLLSGGGGRPEREGGEREPSPMPSPICAAVLPRRGPSGQHVTRHAARAGVRVDGGVRLWPADQQGRGQARITARVLTHGRSFQSTPARAGVRLHGGGAFAGGVRVDGGARLRLAECTAARADVRVHGGEACLALLNADQ
jgi:hypothetical protein